ncbi:FAD-dependent oxidoreductase [Hydrogenoanaerobacterium sp.]|uniref:FAD-dependent oxidoreductase n=1 Tax=Hydrogenoanaerobacterium sp. TaxID=2953763 RepID=UPI0028A1E392|nr:FAD-dependent oxidoreductase [Hydrogenoanaerobacterium sp.]
MKQMLSYDVAIMGGGPAGAVAAIAAARGGAKTLLVEQGGYLGGALTACGTGPQMTFHAGKTQVVRGIADEIVERLKALDFSLGHMDDFVGYASSVTPFDAEGMKLVLETMALEAGVTLLYHTTYTGCTVKNGRIQSVQLYAKNGFFDVEAQVFLDCTADADLAAHAGVPTVYGRETDHLAQPMTMNIKVAGVDREKMMDYVVQHQQDMLPTIPFDCLQSIPRTGMQGAYSQIRLAKGRGEFDIDRDMVLCFETNNKGEFILNMSRITKKSAIDAFDLTDATVEGRRQAHQIVAFMKKYIPGFENCHILSTGPHIGIRESRKIDGIYKLTAEDLLGNRMFSDAIAMGGYPIDIHSPDGESMCHRYLRPGSWYSVPYRCLVTSEVENLIVAGRCISATHEACAAVRVTPIVMAVAEAAGTAAAQSALGGTPANRLETEPLRAALRSNGVFLEEYNE